MPPWASCNQSVFQNDPKNAIRLQFWSLFAESVFHNDPFYVFQNDPCAAG